MFILTAVALYIIIRNQRATRTGIDTDIGDLHRIDGKLKNYLSTSASNIRAATEDNSTALDLISRLEKNNERFRKLILSIQKGTEN